MRILIDALTAREGGGVTYMEHVLAPLARAGAAHEFHVLLSTRYQQALLNSLPAGVRALPVDLRADRMVSRLWFEQAGIPRLVRRGRFDLLYTVNEVGAIRPPCPHVVLARNPNVYFPVPSITSRRARASLLFYRLTRRPIARATLRGATRAVFVSESFRQELTDLLGLDPARTRVVHHGLSPAFSGRDDVGPPPIAGLPEHYLLCVSSLAAHKNFDTLVAAYADVARRRGAGFPALAIAGSTTDRRLFDALVAQAHSSGVGDRVRFLGRVPYAQLPALYRHSAGFVFPSRLETFGHPLVEAMASGVPVVASSLPVCREVCEDAALYFDPARADELADRLETLATDEPVRRAMIARGLVRARDFSWDETARRMVEVFEEAAASPPPADIGGRGAMATSSRRRAGGGGRSDSVGVIPQE